MLSLECSRCSRRLIALILHRTSWQSQWFVSGGIGGACARALASEGCDVALHFCSNQVSELIWSSTLPTLLLRHPDQTYIKTWLKLSHQYILIFRLLQAAVQALAEDLTSKYPAQSFTIHQADLSQRESTRGLIDSVLQVGSSKPPKHQSISILILNAALGRRIRDVKEIECSDWDEMLEVNCTNQFILIKTCLDSNHGKMRQEQWGRIILIGSISSKGAGINGQYMGYFLMKENIHLSSSLLMIEDWSSHRLSLCC